MTKRRMQVATVAATAGGGLLTAAFLQAALAVAAPGEDAFTIDGTTFDPTLAAGGEGFDLVGPLSLAPPLLGLGGGKALGVLNLAPQSFDLYSGTGSDASALGSIDTNETVSYLFGLPNTAFTVLDSTPADGVDASLLPEQGTVYDVFNLGGGFYNVYVATPGEDGTVTDTLVTPFGNTDLSSLFADMNAANPLQPGDAFTALQAGDSTMPDAFNIGGFTFDPFSTGTDGTVTEGFTPVDSLAGIPPLLNLGGGQLTLSTSFPETQPTPFAPQDFDIYSGTGSSATDLGTAHTAVDVTNLLGMTNTEFIVQSVTPADGVDASTLPPVGTVYDALNLGGGWTNVYTATPGEDGTVTDTLVTPFGNMDLSSLFGGINAADPLDPGDAFTGLQAGDSSLGDDAFSLGGYVFDPFTTSDGVQTEGFQVIPTLIGAAPLLSLGGVTVGLGTGSAINFAPQDFDIYGSDDTDLGTVHTSVNTTSLLGMANTEFTIQSVTPADGMDASALPEEGTVYDVFNLGGGWQNIYIATPGDDGTITDTLVTPFGNVDLSSLFDAFNAADPLDPGDAFNGLGDAADAASAAASSWDPLAFLGF